MLGEKIKHCACATGSPAERGLPGQRLRRVRKCPSVIPSELGLKR